MTEEKSIKYLNNINCPDDLKAIPEEELSAVADEIRRELVRIVTSNGGHLASNLGAVELTMAIHRVFDSPRDHVIFDVGHQSYVHKLLTGRYPQMDTLRKAGGISGFTNRDESPHDCFGAGHSSTSLSAALGFAISDKLSGSDAYTVAVLGDGAYTGGMIHEALNNCKKDLNMVIILNENEMSISKNIGRFATNLSKLRTRPGYFRTKKATGAFLKRIPLIGKYLFKFVLTIKKGLKSFLYGSNYFESMGLTYLGPIDGNDITQVESLLKEAKRLGESVIVHVKTVKGKGYAPAEVAPDKYHGMSPAAADKTPSVNFSSVMGEHITSLAEKDDRICAITAAMCDGTGLCSFREKHPSRFFDVGIAEEHALTFAAGLAAAGKIPVVAVYSTFLQRGYDSIVHDIALQKLPVIMCVDRAGLNGSDGATHHGIFDVAFLSHIPNLKIYAPITNEMLRLCLDVAIAEGIPAVIRYPNGCEEYAARDRFYKTPPRTVGAVSDFDARSCPHAVIVTHGRMVANATAAAEKLKQDGISCGIILLELLKPYDICAENVEALLPRESCAVIFLEEEIKIGGMGMNLSEKLSSRSIMQNKKLRIIATDDTFVTERRSGESIHRSAKVDPESIYQAIKNLI